MYVLTGLRHLANCGVLHVCVSILLSGGVNPYVVLRGLPRARFGRSIKTLSWRYRGYVSRSMWIPLEGSHNSKEYHAQMTAPVKEWVLL
jgi:hypothetical protein